MDGWAVTVPEVHTSALVVIGSERSLAVVALFLHLLLLVECFPL
jgi:hypothetical protein